uniref:Uncharacterized protein n=1 Tax=Ixodes ricinus TaxID=34613 RepID=A0A6B0UBN7_IXORI
MTCNDIYTLFGQAIPDDPYSRRQDEYGRASHSDARPTALIAFHHALAAQKRSRLKRRRSVFEGRKLTLEAKQLKYIPSTLILSATIVATIELNTSKRAYAPAKLP